jgi:phage host-nuclease inhibitor protein Gam
LGLGCRRVRGDARRLAPGEQLVGADMSVEEFPQWIDDVDPGVFEDSDCCPDDDEVAVREWVDRKLRRIAALRREKTVTERIVANERARIDEYEIHAVGGLDKAIAFHQASVEQWMLARLEANPKVRSYQLPAGTVQARALPDAVECDPDITLPWLQEHWPELTRIKVEIDKRALNDAVKHGIGDIPGVAVTPGRVNITLTTGAFE